MGQKDVEIFIKYMKEQFAKIPRNLTSKEYRERAERYRELAESYERYPNKTMEKKKYELLYQKYTQLANEKDGKIPPREKISFAPERVELIQDQEESRVIVQKSGFPWFASASLLLAIAFFLNNFYNLIDVTTANVVAIILAIVGFFSLFKN